MRRKTKMADSHFAPIVGDGAIAHGSTADGRAIPVVVVDCANHKELLNLVHLHVSSPPGDADCTWGANKKHAFLLFSFTKPSVVQFGLMFDLQSQANLADGIVQSQGVYIQPSEFGSRVSEGLDGPKILVEVSPKTKLPDWDERLIKAVSQKMRHKGMSKRQAKEAAKEYLKRTREIWSLRMSDV
ncbi:hypothetical protein [Marinobacter salsuginis]|uniref:hypothetical protein n=1 Tax=Marinobacter salsuginis TaxID=418719 RepID=UPI001ADF39FC|nr:hypothetical protein [Marinobacter salsuginis]QTN41445.1 hypothetical protein HZ997_17675 [Marinobacter salsuginis]